jgi:hypothetical protein
MAPAGRELAILNVNDGGLGDVITGCENATANLGQLGRVFVNWDKWLRESEVV